MHSKKCIYVTTLHMINKVDFINAEHFSYLPNSKLLFVNLKTLNFT